MANEKQVLTNCQRLIDVNEVIDAMQKCIDEAPVGEYPVATYAFQSIIQCLKQEPTVDAVEVVHGEWIDSYSADHMGRIIEHSIDCSVCENVFKDDSREVVKRWKERFKVCPFCGAMMDGGNEE